MLKEIYDYGRKAKIASAAGFKLKNVKAYISLSAKGEFVAIDAAPEEKQLCPDIGSMANGRDKCNILVEKADIVFAFTDKGKAKNPFYLSTLEQAGEYDPFIRICFNALQNDEAKEKIIAEFRARNYKDGDVISFKVDNLPIERSKAYLSWWHEFRSNLNANEEKRNESLCYITGERCEPLKTVPKFSGLFAVGGHTAGDSLICFDKPTFTSYNLDQAENCTVSENAMTAVNFTLEKLVASAPTVAGTKFVHWYKEPLPKDNDCDILSAIITPVISDDEEFNKESNQSENQYQEIVAIQNAKTLIESVKKGGSPNQLNNRYYILSLSGAGGRVMIRNYQEGSYEQLYENVKAWYDDLLLVNAKWPSKLNGIYSRLLKHQNGGADIGKRFASELAGLDSRIIYAIVNNTPLPDTVAAKALAYIRSDMFSNDDDSKAKGKAPDKLACRILKAWLIRKEIFEKGTKREDVSMKESLNEQNQNNAYLAGRMMAVYAKIQETALGDVGAGVIQRYYTAASTSPALVIGRLSTLSQHHLGKLTKGANIYYTNILADISAKVEGNFPAALNLEQQSQFALGYYQQISELYKKKTDPNEIN
ncbi:MAG: type I-C CRISPR-associated protein Cas8c/Csd1 [Clostridiaceae bacterium]|nr:type I-C CRISPR-associated protein Cas8c/Csd1 [Clostridiaceae bacterium]